MRFTDFCEKCGTMMDIPRSGRNVRGAVGEIVCLNTMCTNKKSLEDYIAHKSTYTLNYENNVQEKPDQLEDDVLGPQIDHQCKACKHHLATYFTRQMRSADEGQTVFYTCMKCKNVEREDS